MPPCQWYVRTYASHPWCLLCCTTIPWQTFAFASVANESLDGPFGLGLRTRNPFFPETSWNVDSFEYSTHFHCLFDYLRWAQAKITQQHRYIELMYSFLLQIFKLHFLMQQQTVVNDSGFLKYSWANMAIFNTAAWRFLMQCHLKAQRSSTFNWGFLHCDFSGFPESFHNITYGTWWKN